ncbi:hypothetical protein TGS27_2795 [Geobacillus stearothermophilus]|uniref:Uncharacterized protein n=2 Tax=Geobacillus TaxID=129337 RepID=A0A1Q5STX2_9BACL|nr:hypothetical protein TGS27_2795 [Geobacillus stearothermophilus]OKO91458.1 hypothetical protein BRO54_2735 [Geobacillus proteiniphilus]
MAELKHRLLVIIMQLKDDPAFTKDDAALEIAKVLDWLNETAPAVDYQTMVRQYAR